MLRLAGRCDPICRSDCVWWLDSIAWSTARFRLRGAVGSLMRARPRKRPPRTFVAEKQGRPARNREVFINVRPLGGSRRALPATRTWPPRAAASIRPGQRRHSFRATPSLPASSSRVDENHPISGMTPSENKGLRLPTTLRLPMPWLFLRHLGLPVMEARFPKQAMSCR